jgi:hypothetical protein
MTGWVQAASHAGGTVSMEKSSIALTSCVAMQGQHQGRAAEADHGPSIPAV